MLILRVKVLRRPLYTTRMIKKVRMRRGRAYALALILTCIRQSRDRRHLRREVLKNVQRDKSSLSRR